MSPDRTAANLEYWVKHLADAPPAIDLPTDRPHTPTQTPRADSTSLVVDTVLSQRFLDLGRREDASPFTSMLAAFAVVLDRQAAQGEVVIGSSFSQGTLALRVDLRDLPSFRTLLARVRDVALAAREHEDVPFDRVVEKVAPDGDGNRPPIFQVMLVAANGEIAIEPATRCDFALYTKESSDGITLALAYNAELFDRARMDELLAQLVRIMEHAIARPDDSVAAYPLDTPTAVSVLPDPTRPLDEPSLPPVAEMIAAIGRAHPDRIALEWRGARTTYGELATASARAARVLVGADVRRGDVVAVRGAATPGLLVWLLGVLRGGGAVLLVDPKLPAARQAVMLREAKTRLLVELTGDGSTREPMLPAIVHADEDGAPRDPRDPQIDLPRVNGDDPAYVFFTSGTTGAPKGVLGCHKGLAHFVSWQRDTFGIGPDDRAAQLTGLSFDVVLRDMLTPLASGATLCLRPDDAELLPETLFRWMAASRVTLAHSVPSIMQVWLDERGAAPAPQLRTLFIAGEPLPAPLVERMTEVFGPACKIVNLYGPTETTLAKCSYVVARPPRPGIQPVGRPQPHAQALVLNTAGVCCGIGEPGEIAIRTPFRTLGYLNVPHEGRFAPNPFRSDPADVIYRTGDRGRFAVDGTLEILGRIDDQVKIRGIRIEPAEVAATLLAHPSISQCAVTVMKHAGEPALIAYVVMSATVDDDHLRTYLKELLVPAMMPKAFVRLDRIPLTANGKVDRKALWVPDLRAMPGGEIVAPRTDIERELALIWSRILGIDEIGVHDDFVARGGHSLLTIRLVREIERTFGVRVPVGQIFDGATIATLGEYIAGTTRSESRIAYVRTDATTAPATSTQEYFWELDRDDHDPASYLGIRVMTIRGNVDPDLLARSYREVAARHSIYRTAYRVTAGVLEQIVQPLDTASIDFDIVDRSPVSEDRWHAEIEDAAATLVARGCDLETGEGLLRARLLKLAADHHVLVQAVHHIATDGAGASAFHDQWSRAYARAPAEQPLEYIDYALARARWSESASGRTEEAFWRDYVRGAPPVIIEGDFPRAELDAHRETSRRGVTADLNHPPEILVLPPPIYARVAAAARAARTTAYVIYMTALGWLLRERSGQDDVAIQSTYSPRAEDPALEQINGCMTTWTLTRIDLSGAAHFSDAVTRTRSAANLVQDRGAPHDYYGIVPHHLRRMSFNYMGPEANATDRHREISFEPQAWPPPLWKRTWDLILALNDSGTSATLVWTGAAKLFRRESTQTLLARYVEILASI